MPKVVILYQGEPLSELIEYGNKVIKTSGKYCEDDITIQFKQSVPDEYQELQYIECTGKQYFTTPAYNISNMTFKMTCRPDSYSSYGNYLICSDSFITAVTLRGMGNGLSYKFLDTSDQLHDMYYGSTSGVLCNVVLSEPNQTISLNSTSTSLQIGTAERISRTYTFFGYSGAPSSSTYCFDGKVYSAELLDGENHILKLVPCYRKSDSIAGLYDLVSNTFYTSLSTTQFVAGTPI